MRYLLNAIYLVLLCGYLPIIWLQRAISGKRRPGLWSKFIGAGPVRQGAQQRACFHAVSLGEVNAIRQLVLEFAGKHPDWEVVISTTTQTGLDAAKKHFPQMEVCLLPFDFTWAVSRFLRNLKPDLLVLAELELWPNLIGECKRRSITTCLINARLNEKSHRKYQRFGFLTKRLFELLDSVCCQHESYAQRFADLGVKQERIHVTGNLKYDKLLTDRHAPEIETYRELIDIEAGQLVLIAGSTQAPEEQIVLETFRALRDRYPELRLLICPRHPERFAEVAAILQNGEVDFARRSLLDSPAKESSDGSFPRVVLLDCMGELSRWWGVGDICFVGGSFGNRGGQNMIEPVAFGNAVCFGPYTRNFAKEVDELTRYAAAEQLEKPTDLTSFVEKCLTQPAFREDLRENAEAFLRDFANVDPSAWKLTLSHIDETLSPSADLRDQQAA